jgi:hypothetical protein
MRQTNHKNGLFVSTSNQMLYVDNASRPIEQRKKSSVKISTVARRVVGSGSRRFRIHSLSQMGAYTLSRECLCRQRSCMACAGKLNFEPLAASLHAAAEIAERPENRRGSQS